MQVFIAWIQPRLSKRLSAGKKSGLGNVFTTVRPATLRWHSESHQFLIDTKEGIGQPTSKGAHREGVDFVVVLQEPLTALLLDDACVIHKTTTLLPSAPVHVPSEAANAWRDTRVLTYRAVAFQAP